MVSNKVQEEAISDPKEFGKEEDAREVREAGLDILLLGSSGGSCNMMATATLGLSSQPASSFC